MTIPSIFRTAFTISAFALALTPLQMRADLITYEFIGSCTDCDGSGVGFLTLQNYTVGQNLDMTNFVSFSYTSNLFSYSVGLADSSDPVAFIQGAIPVDMPSSAFVEIMDTQSPAATFFSFPGGSWCVGQNCGADNGPSSTWNLATAAPEPSTLIPAVLGLSAFVWSRRRRRK